MYVNENDDLWLSIDDGNPLRQQEQCYAIAFNNDGTIMVSGCSKNLKIWQLANGQLKYDKKKFIIKAHSKDVNTIYYSKKQNMFISGSDDKSIKLWLMGANNQFTCQQTLAGHKHWVTQVIMNKDEDTIFSSSWDGELKIWRKEGAEWKCVQSIQEHKSQITSISINESSTWLASVGWDNQICVYQKDNAKRWNLAQKIELQYQGFRIGFLGDNQFVYQPKKIPMAIIYQLNQGTKQFEKKNNGVDLNKIEDDCSYFPIQYIKDLQAIVVKHAKNIYVIKKQNDDNFNIIKSIPFEDDRIFGSFTENQATLVTWDYHSKSYRVQKP